MTAKPHRWVDAFEEFIKDLRISSKEAVAEDDRGVKLELWDSQRRFLNFVGEGLDRGIRKFYVLKSRQLGLTTISLAIDLFWMAVHSGMTGSLVSDTEKNRDANRNILEKYMESFPENYFGDGFKIVKNNRAFMTFSNGSRLDFLVAGTKQKSIAWGQGQGYAHGHCTEVGSYGSSDGLESYEESFAQTNPNRLMIYESTAAGFNHWRTRYLEAKEDPLTKATCFCGWWSGDMNRIERSDPRFQLYGGYAPSGDERERVAAVQFQYGHKMLPEQLAWIRWRQDHEQDPEMLLQNQPWTEQEAFVMTGYSFFQVREISKEIRRIDEGGMDYGYRAYRYELGHSFFDVKLEKITSEESKHQIELRVWDEPKDDAKYVIGCDSAYGRSDHKDRQAISVWRCYSDKMVQVAEYATGNVEPKHTAWVLAHLAGAYRDCIVNVEINGPGAMIMHEWDHIRSMLNAEMNEARVRSLQWEDALSLARWYLYHRPDSFGAGYAANFETTWKTKSQIMFQMRGAFVTNELLIKSIPLLHEMQNVVQDGASIGAPESKSEDGKDDRVFAAALAIRAWINWVQNPMLQQGLTYQRVTEEETGQSTPVKTNLNSMVYRFFKTQEELAGMAPDKPKWLADRGLV